MRYEPGDEVTYYFIIMKENNLKTIVGWTDDKDIAKAYMEFHGCKNYHMKEITTTIEEIGKILEESIHDEIRLMNISVKNVNKKKHEDEIVFLTIPATELQIIHLKDESSHFLYSLINYSVINDAMAYLKGKYRRALEDIYLQDVINTVIHGQSNRITSNILFDELKLFIRTFPDHFGL